MDQPQIDRHTKITALSDQAWAAIRESRADIKRIAEEGPRPDEHDQMLIRQVFCAVTGDIYLARVSEALGT